MADGADAAVVDPLAPPKSVAAPKGEYTTYSDDASLGKPAPSLDTLEYFQGEPVKLGDGKITVILFWAKFAKGDYTTYAGVSDLAKKFAGVENVQFLGVS